MAFEHKDFTGTLFRNDRKTGKQPDYRGECKIRGEMYEIGAWVKESTHGKKYFSFQFSEPYSGGGGNQSQPVPDEDTPF